MKFIIKLIALALALTTLGGVLAACRGGGDETDSGGSGNNGQNGSAGGNKETVTLTVWGAQEDQQMLK